MSQELFNARAPQLFSSTSCKLLETWDKNIYTPHSQAISDEALKLGFENSPTLLRQIKLCHDEISSTTPALYPYLFVDPERKPLIRQQLLRAHYLCTLQSQIESMQLKWDALQSHQKQCRYYEKLLNELNQAVPKGQQASMDAHLITLSNASEKPLGYCGAILIAPTLAGSMVHYCSGTINPTQQIVRRIKKQTSYVGWSRSFVLTLMSRIPEVFGQSKSEASAIGYVGTSVSYINFITTQTLFAMEIALLLKNSLVGLWSKKNQAISCNPLFHFTTQMKHKKFVLLDSLSSSVSSLVALLCLAGSINAWPWSMVVSVGQRVFQLGLMAFRYQADHALYEKRMLDLKTEIEALEKLKISQDQREFVVAHASVEEIDEQIVRLKKEQASLEKEWKYKTIEFHNQLMFVMGMLVGTAMFCCLFFPPSALIPASILIIGLIGAGICIAMSVLNTTMTTNLELAKIYEAQDTVKERLTSYHADFLALNRPNLPQMNQLKLQQIYYEMLQLATQSEHKKRLIQYHKMSLYVQTMIDSLMPVSMIASIVLIPAGVGLPIICTMLALNLLIKGIVNWMMPVESKHLQFNDSAFQDFCKNPDLAHILPESARTKYTMFLSNQEAIPDDDLPSIVEPPFK